MDSEQTEFDRCLVDFLKVSRQLRKQVQSCKNVISDSSWNGEKGIGLFEMKNHQMLEYLLNTAHLVLLKLHGNSIAGDPTVERLVEIRTVLEKIRPIEHKMQLQIQQLIKNASNASHKRTSGSTEDRAHPEEQEESGSDSGSDEDNDPNKSKTKKYVPPKLMAVPYQEEDGGDAAADKARRRMLRSSLIQDLSQQYSEAPDEIQEYSGEQRRKQLDEMKHRQAYEEENFVRLQMGKKERSERRKQAAMGVMDTLLDFGSFDPYPESATQGAKSKTLKSGKRKFKKVKSKYSRKKHRN